MRRRESHYRLAALQQQQKRGPARGSMSFNYGSGMLRNPTAPLAGGAGFDGSRSVVVRNSPPQRTSPASPAHSTSAASRAPIGRNSPSTRMLGTVQLLPSEEAAGSEDVFVCEEGEEGEEEVQQSYDMEALLDEVGLGRLALKFSTEDITPEMLPYLDDNAMRDLGVSSVGARLRLRMLAGSLGGAGGN